MHFFHIFAAAVMVLLAGPPLGGAANAAPDAQPPAIFFDDHYDAGTVVEGALITHAFVIRNTGKTPLALNSIEAGCRCTATDFDRVIAPGKTGAIRVSITTEGDRGPVKRRLIVHADHPDIDGKTLLVSARIIPTLTVSPDRIYFNGPPSAVQTISVQVSGNKPEPLHLELLRNNLPTAFSVELIPMEKNNGCRLKVTHNSRNPGTVRGRIVLKTNYPDCPMIAVPVMARINAVVDILPRSLDFGSICMTCLKRNPAKADKTVYIRNHSEEKMQITGIDALHPVLNTKIQEVEPGKVIAVHVSLRPDALKKGPLETQLQIHTTSPHAPVLKVPVRMEVQP